MNGFSWVVEDEIAGMSRPDFRNDEIWQWLADQGVGLVVTLTEHSPDADFLAKHGLVLQHLPIRDFAPPSNSTLEKFLEMSRFYRHEGKGVVVHCGAGRGRTGTMIACYLVDNGMAPDEAIHALRAIRPGSIETEEQEQAVHDFAARQKSEN